MVDHVKLTPSSLTAREAHDNRHIAASVQS
jgi:hypothetical protein